MAEPFYTRIPTLSDAELREYITHYSKYRFEAIEVAANELSKRGHTISSAELNSIQESILNKKGRTPNYIKRVATHSKSMALSFVKAVVCATITLR